MRSDPLFQTILELAEYAGRLAVRSLAASSLVSEVKPDATLVTHIDRELEEHLWERLSSLYPDIGFLGEETGVRGASTERYWVVDPIDGTTNLVRGLPLWGIAIGLMEFGRPTLGVLHLPLLSETFAAREGERATLNGAPLEPEDRGVLDQEDLLAVTSNASRALDFSATQGRLRTFGSICAELCYTAAGRFAACVSMGDKFTDLVAPLCICREAGLEFRWLDGRELDLMGVEQRRGTEGLLVAPPRTLNGLLDRLRARA